MLRQSPPTILLATDQQQSVLNALDANQPHPIAYTPYGHRPRENGLLSLIGFNGELPDPVTGHYHLGKGYRQFNPVLMRFNSPDSWSPFGEGGLNAYAYCKGDPKNKVDPKGHSPISATMDAFLKRLATGVSNRSRNILRASSGVRPRRIQNMDSLPPTSATISNSATPSRQPPHNGSRSTYSAEHIQAATTKINQNVPIAEIIGQYTQRFNTADVNISSSLYTEVRKNYSFIRLPISGFEVPDIRVAHWSNTNQLDTRHWDVTISHIRNTAEVQNHLIPGSGARFHTLANVQEIRRAQYIRRNTGINLLR
ncbi:hypothetical protein D3C71_875980 [compost metagenome]